MYHLTPYTDEARWSFLCSLYNFQETMIYTRNTHPFYTLLHSGQDVILFSDIHVDIIGHSCLLVLSTAIFSYPPPHTHTHTRYNVNISWLSKLPKLVAAPS